MVRVFSFVLSMGLLACMFTQMEDMSLDKDTLESRFIAPANYQRLPLDSNGFAFYLRNLPLLPEGSKVKYFNGKEKLNKGVYTAVIDQKIGRKDLHQCADAIMRMRAEYLFSIEKYDQIAFNLTNGFPLKYSGWRNGDRIKVDGNKVEWIKGQAPNNTSLETLESFLGKVYMYAGTASLEKELITISIDQVDIGDVLIKGGYPGHAVLIVDKVIHELTGKKLFLLGQSYMPAQQFQILANPNSTNPWYDLSQEVIVTPEWTFSLDQCRRFVE